MSEPSDYKRLDSATLEERLRRKLAACHDALAARDAELSRLQEENERLKGLAQRINMSAVLIPELNGEAAVSGALIAELATALASQEQGGSDRG